jgi:4-amino-4-deoxy-L-arabinose transferase-like glycosyltransferase
MKMLNLLSQKSAGLFVLAFAALVVAIGILLDALLIDLGAPRMLMLLFDDLLTGVAAGAALWLALRSEVRRRQQENYRLLVLDEMNHHVRNALQVMTLCSYSIGGEKGEELSKAVQRIQWSLTEVLPKVNFDSPFPSQSDEFAYQRVEEPPKNPS